MPNSLQYDSQLIEESLLTAGIAVAADQLSPLAVFQNANGDSEALVIHQDLNLYHVAREPLSQSGWNSYGAGAAPSQLAVVNATNAYAVTSYDTTTLWQLNNGNWQSYASSLNLTALFGGWDGTLWTMQVGQNWMMTIYQFINGAWQQVGQPLANASAIAGSADNYWVLDTGNTVTNYATGTATQYPLKDSMPVNLLAVAPNGQVWLLDVNSTLFELVEQQWQVVGSAPDGLTWVQADGNNTLWGVNQPDQNNNALVYFRNDGTWQQVAWPAAISNPLPHVGMDGSLMVVDDSGKTWLLAGGPSGSWQRVITPTGLPGFTNGLGPVTEVVTGCNSHNVWNAFYVQNGSVYQKQLIDGAWTGGTTVVVTGNGLGLTNCQQTGELICYGVTSDNHVFYVDESNTVRQFAPQAGFDLQNAILNLTAVNDDKWVTTAVVNSALVQAWGSKAAPLTYPGTQITDFWPVTDALNPNQPQNNLQQVLRLPWVQAEGELPYTTVMDRDGNIFGVYNMGLVPTIFHSVGSFVQLSGTGFSGFSSATTAGAIIDSTGMARIYATDSNSQVWVLRQTGLRDNNDNPWTWSQWHPLGDNCAYLANGPGALQTTEMFALSPDNTLYLLDQQADTGQWNSALIKRPAGASEDVDQLTAYKTEITVLDDNGNPAPGSQLTVTAAEQSVLWIEGQQYLLAAGQSVTGVANAFGKLRVMTPATGLHTSALTVTPAGGGAAQMIYPPQHVHDFLAGRQPLKGRTFTRNGQALINATDANGAPFNGFGNLAQNGNVPAAATAIMNIAGVQPASSSLRAKLALLPAAQVELGSASSIWDKLWNDLVNYTDDIFHAIRNGVIEVVEVTVDAVSKVISLTVQFVNDTVRRVCQFAVSTYQDIAHALHCAFQWIEAEVDTVIDWLKALFDWSAITNTQQVFNYFIQQSIPWLQGEITQGQTLANNFFQNLEGDVQTWFNWLQTQFTGQTMNQAANSPSTNSQLTFNGFHFPASICMFGTEVNWLLEKVESYLFGSSSDSLNPVSVVQQAAQTFWQTAEPAWTDLKAAVNDLQNFIEGAVKHPGDFKQLAATDLLNAMEKVILAALQFADAVIQTFLALVKAALGYVDNILNYNINLPLVSKLFEEATGQPLTAINLFTMLLAVPVTVGYKLVTGDRYLFTNEQVNQITGSKLKAAAAAQPDPALVKAFYWCSGTVNLVWTAFDTALDGFRVTPPLGLQILDIVFPTVLQIFGWPGGVPFTAISMDKASEKWAFGNWMVGWSPITLNIPLLLVGRLLDPASSKVARYSDPVGKGILTGIGLVNLGVGAAASGLGKKDGSVDAAGIIANTLSPMPNLFQFLRIQEVETASEELTYYIKLMLDFFMGAGTSVAVFVEGNQSSATAAA